MKKIKAEHIVIFLLLGLLVSCNNPFFPDKLEKGGGTGKTAQELADDFKDDYADALELEVDSVTTNDERIVKDALEAYEKLRDDAKELLAEEKELLDSLKEKIDELIAAATAQELADTFKEGNAGALALTPETVTPLDEAIVDAALESYELLRDDAKALLTEEKELLDSLKEKIDGLRVRIIITNLPEWNAAITTITSGGNGTSTSQKYYTLTIGGDFDLAGSTSNRFSPSYITVILNGRGTIGLSSSGNLFCIGSNQTLVIDSETLTLEGRSGNNTSVLYTNTGSQLELRSGTIKGNTSYNYGGGVFVSGGTFTMSGGSISENLSPSGGGGVYVSGGTFIMSGGTISENKSGYGGGVHVSGGGTFTMSGGSITENTVDGSGGGVFVSGGIFTMSGGSITENKNTAIGGAGGVSVANGGTFTMSGGSITSNISNNQGGGVYVSNSTFTKANDDTGNSGIISGNTATTANGQQVHWSSSPVRYVNDPLGETDELSTSNPDIGWLSE